MSPGSPPGSPLGEALDFFIYDTLKIFLLLTAIVFVVAVIRSSFPPEKTKRILSHKREYAGNVLAALLGVVMSFCSCSAMPLFIGFVESGVPLGVTFSVRHSSLEDLKMEKKDMQVCPITGELEPLLEAIRRRFSQLTDDDCQRKLFLNRLRGLGRFSEEPAEYVKPEEALLPKELEIAYAVCGTECGNEAYMVLDGGSQSCDRCGSSMLPVKFGSYRLKRK